MDVNVRPGLVLDESENKENFGDFNTMQRMQGSMKNGRRRIQTGIPEVPIRSLSLVVANQDIFRGNAKERDGIMKEEATEIKKAEEWQNWRNQWQTCKS